MFRHEAMRVTPKFSKEYSAKSIVIDNESYTITGKSGYLSSLAIGTRPLPTFYFEATIENDIGHARIGIASKDCEKYGPIGMDENGYSFGDKNGYGFHNSRRIRFGERYKKGDIVSVYLYKEKRKKILEFFINGERQFGKFIIDTSVSYCPAVSIFGGCKVKCNFGPYYVYEDAVKIKIENMPLL